MRASATPAAEAAAAAAAAAAAVGTTAVAPSSVVAMAAAVRAGAVSAESLTAAALRRLAAAEPSLSAFLTVDAAAALAAARAVDADVAAGRGGGALAGVPLAVKDNLCTAGLTTTAASAVLADHTPAYTATAVARAVAAGAVVLGKTNMDEFGMGSSTERSAFGPTANPWDTTRVPGGSSGGSAAAVAAGVTPVALGTDTGGSVRQPASFCGVTGYKPSYGRVSRHGLLAYASSLDTVGVLAGSVADAAVLAGVMAGGDGFDPTALDGPVPDFSVDLAAVDAAGPSPLAGLTVGIVSDERVAVDAAAAAAVEATAETLRGLGATTRPVSLPRLPAAVAAYYVLAPAEASANLARYDGLRYGSRGAAAGSTNVADLVAGTRGGRLGDETRRRILLGTFALSAGYHDALYGRAQAVRAAVAADYAAAWAAGVDVLLSAVAPAAAPRRGAGDAHPTAVYAADALTVPPSLAGLPAVAVPAGVDVATGGMPVGVQLVGPRGEDARVLRVGHAFQTVTDWHLRRPPLAAEVAAAADAAAAAAAAV